MLISLAIYLHYIYLANYLPPILIYLAIYLFLHYIYLAKLRQNDNLAKLPTNMKRGYETPGRKIKYEQNR